VHYPAAYRGALAVSAVGPQGRLAPYSSFGPEVRIAAPGGDKSQGEEAGVLQETIDPSDPAGKGVYRWFQGTSMATPHVAGAAALVASLGVTDPAAIERLLASTARDSGQEFGTREMHDERYGAGLLDAAAAVRTATVWWTLWRIALAAIGAFVALFHARKLGHLRTRNGAPAGLWPALLFGSGALALLSPVGLARVQAASLLALPLPALPERFLGAAGTSLVGSLAAYAAWSAIVPLVIALVARVATPLRGIAAGLAFGQAGVLLHAAFFRTVYLPVLPAFLVPFWLFAGAFIAWWIGRALLTPEATR